MDKRQQRTQKLILQAFIKLLDSKTYPKITVQDIIDEAQVGRSTFYAHFETKDFLLKAICDELFSHICANKLFAESTHDFSLVSNNPHILFTHILYHLRDNKQNTIHLLSSDSEQLYLSYFKPSLNDLIVYHVFDQLKPKNTFVPENFLINHISSSFINMVQWWIDHKLQERPEDLSRYFEKVIIPVI